MRNIILSILFFGIIIANSIAADSAKSESYMVDIQKSSVEWLGKKVTGQHNGTINIKAGTIKMDGNSLTGGEFKIDMKSIVVLDLKDPGYNKKLTDHLNSDDFFSVESYPTSELKITNVSKINNNEVNIRGDLTIKGITHPIEFPASLTMGEGTLEAKANITIDRAKYNVRYGSGSFFKGLGDKLIYDDFNLTINLIANSK
jgi:polyisoprenoid-binding protein YceI